jgi:hypothetical protein
MDATPSSDTAPRPPRDFRAVPIHSSGGNVPLRLCVLARKTPDPTAGRFFQLADLPDARVYLGCVCDAGEHIREWVELWVQTVEGLGTGPAAQIEPLSNHLLDQRWAARRDALRDWAPESLIETGWETRHPLPVFIDLATFSIIYPKGVEDGAGWELCQDDALLEAAGLPPYRSSLSRFLYQPMKGKDSPFVPLTGDAAANASSAALLESLGLSGQVVPFNAHGGLMMAVSFHPFGYEDYIDLLGGKPWSGLEHGKTQVQLGELYQSLTESDPQQDRGGHLFLGLHGRKGRLLETLHLKLQLLADVFRAVRVSLRTHQAPCLNLSPESFRVKLADLGVGLPFLWTAKCALVLPPESLALDVKSAEDRVFVRAGRAGRSIYLPEGQIASSRGLGNVRIRKVLPHEPEAVIIEGTLRLQEPSPCSPRDLLWVRLPLSTGSVDFYGHIDSDSLASSEVRFRTLPRRLPEACAQALRSGAVVVFPRCQYEIITLLSSPCDLYSLGVLAIRTLLVNDKTALPVALDDLLSLAHQVAVEHHPDLPLPARIGAIFARKPGWLESLGPHRLLAIPLGLDEANALVPAGLWHEVLAAIVRLFPGAGPDSYCADLNDAPPLALETVLDPPLTDFQNLLLKTRSLIVIDWAYNREVRAAIDDFRKP